ncbi:MAG: glycosyltransferase [Candidatus Methylomirabilis sp.]|nr:glycosyltransferase [Deltaproteobacteria bacterium]
MHALDWTILAAYFALCGVLSLYGLHRFFLMYLYFRHADRRARAGELPAERPLVCVQLPIFNERYVVERLLVRVADLDWPRDRLHIQLLDDSTDDTTEIAAGVAARLREKGAWIDHVRRPDRVGFKAGALQYGLARTEADFIAVFDADFLPSPDFLGRTMPHLAAPEIGMVQARWGHLNRDHSLLTRLQSILLDGHFVIESAARHRSGRLLNFNGTAGVWRRRAIEEAGGWQHDTLTEDLDLSYRAQMAGWRFVYVSDYVVPAEVPEDMNAFKSQQHRWAKGSVQTARKLLVPLMRSRLSRAQKVEALFHLTGNASYPFMGALALLMFPALGARLRLDRALTLGQQITLDVGLFMAATLSVLAFYLVSQRG